MIPSTDYQPQIITALSVEESLIECSPEEAQVWCNFVLFAISNIPKGFAITKQQLRKESQNAPSSFRYLLQNNQNNCISVKQFLYDWAPPAYDYPCLWLNTAQFSSADILPPRPIIAKNRVLWIGKNYRGQNAATIDLERTRIEITFDNVDLTDKELINIIQACKPCDEIKRKQILNAPFSHLSYYARHKKTASEVPLSYWKHTRLNSCYGRFLSLADEFTHQWLPPHVENILNNFGYYLNSIFCIDTPTNEMAEKEYLFEHHQAPGVFIHILATPSSSVHAIEFPPTIGDQVCKHETIEASENKIYLAHANQVYGNYEFIWKRQQRIYLMIIRAAPWVSYHWSIDLMLKIGNSEAL